jgi:hypothetical protein
MEDAAERLGERSEVAAPAIFARRRHVHSRSLRYEKCFAWFLVGLLRGFEPELRALERQSGVCQMKPGDSHSGTASRNFAADMGGRRGTIDRADYLIDRFRVRYAFGGGWACSCADALHNRAHAR